jgi:hypothetical protein
VQLLESQGQEVTGRLRKQRRNLSFLGNIIGVIRRYLCSMLTDDGKCTCEIKSRIAMAKAAFNKKKTLFTSKLDLN